MKLAMICRYDNSGLGTLSWEFAEHLRPDKILLVSNGVFQTFPERFKDFNCRFISPHKSILKEDQEWLFEDIDVILSLETFYNWGVVAEARRVGVKTVLVTMFEMTQKILPLKPDLFICPSKLDYDVMPDPKVYIPIPVNTKRLRWRKRTAANHFIHTASHGGMNARKGTPLLLEAVKRARTEFKLTIYSWFSIECNDLRVTTKRVNFKEYWQCWQEGDVLIYPQDYNGICLPVIEAMASGLGVITTDIYPFNEYFPKELMFKPSGFYKTSAGSGLIEVDAAKIDPWVLADKIDEWFGKDISKFSEYGRYWAQKNSWEILGPQYSEALAKLL